MRLFRQEWNEGLPTRSRNSLVLPRTRFERMTLRISWPAMTRAAMRPSADRYAYCLGGFYRNDIGDIRVSLSTVYAAITRTHDIPDICVSQIVNTNGNTNLARILAFLISSNFSLWMVTKTWILHGACHESSRQRNLLINGNIDRTSCCPKYRIIGREVL